ncbi:MAG: hypothetical protein ABII09_02350 [Planctomycetota bacterium]
MRAILVRVGIDQEYGHWNSPADEVTQRFLYVPIPEMRPQRRGCERSYEQLIPYLTQFASGYNLDLWRDLKFPSELKENKMHLDPDFGYLTYGDDICDSMDNCPETSNTDQSDLDGDGIGDLCECYRANIDGINPVNFNDFAKLAFNWLESEAEGDTNWDGIVDYLDLAQVAQHWLEDCSY